MQIDFERSGGFTGIPLTVSVDTDSLAANEAYELKELVTVANFFKLPARTAAASSGAADQFSYRLTVNANGQKHTLP